jgi:protein translocase SecG subunit
MITAILQIAVSVALIALILLQERSAGLSGIFGGEGGGFYQTRRGLEKIIFGATIVLAVVFVALSLAQLIGGGA